MPMDKLMPPAPITREELEAIAAEKRRNNLIGGIADVLGNSQSVGNFALGRLNPHDSSIKDAFSAMNDQADEPIRQKAALLKAYQDQKAMAKVASEEDPNSPLNQAMNEAINKISGARMPGLAESLKNAPYEIRSGLLQKVLGGEYDIKAQQARAQTDLANKLEEIRLAKRLDLQGDLQKLEAQGKVNGAALSRDQRLAKLSAEEKKRLDLILMGIRSTEAMKKDLDSGVNTFSVVGDNPYTLHRRQASEAFGRLQSGGAINKDEEERFEKTSPGFSDSRSIRERKLREKALDFQSRLNNMGFKPEDFGLASHSDSVDPDAKRYAEMHGLPIEQAERIVSSRKAQMNKNIGMR